MNLRPFFVACLVSISVPSLPCHANFEALKLQVEQIKIQRQYEDQLLEKEKQQVRAVAYSLTRNLCIGYRFILGSEPQESFEQINRADNPQLFASLVAWGQIFNEGLWASFSTTKQIVHDRRGDHWLDARRWLTSNFLIELVSSPQYAQALIDCFPSHLYNNWTDLTEEWKRFTYVLYMFEGLVPFMALEGIFSAAFSLSVGTLRITTRPIAGWLRKMMPKKTYWSQMVDFFSHTTSFLPRLKSQQKVFLKKSALLSSAVIGGDNLVHYLLIDPIQTRKAIATSQRYLASHPDSPRQVIEQEPSWRVRILLFEKILSTYQQWQNLNARQSSNPLSEEELALLDQSLTIWTKLLEKNVIVNYETYKQQLQEILAIKTPTAQDYELTFLLDTVLRLAEARMNYYAALKLSCLPVPDGSGYQCP